MFGGQLVPCHETAARLDYVLAEMRRRPARQLCEPGPADLALMRRIHSPRCLAFLANAWDEWTALGPSNSERDILPSVWPGRGLRCDVEPVDFSARVGLHAFHSGSPITAGTWDVSRTRAAQALLDAGALPITWRSDARWQTSSWPPCSRRKGATRSRRSVSTPSMCWRASQADAVHRPVVFGPRQSDGRRRCRLDHSAYAESPFRPTRDRSECPARGLTGLGAAGAEGSGTITACPGCVQPVSQQRPG
jgi:hypothetical protein